MTVSPVPSHSPWQLAPPSCLWTALTWTCHVNRVTRWAAMCVCHSLSTVSPGSLHVVARVSTSFLFRAVQ